MKYNQHPLSSAYPAMSKENYDALVADIRTHGQRDVATVYDGMVLDGWHRYQACEEIGIPCRIEEFSGNDPAAYVISKNTHRRQLTESQRAAAVVAIREWRATGKGGTCHPSSATVSQMAVEANVDERTIQRAKRAYEAGLGDAVRDGLLSANKAAEIAKANPELAKKVAHGEVSLPKAVEQVGAKKPRGKKTSAPKSSTSASPVCSAEVEALRTELKELQERYDDQKERFAEIATQLEEAVAEAASLSAVVDSNEPAKTALAEAKKFREINRILEERIRGLMNEKNEAIRSAKYWQRQAKQAGR